MLQLNGEANVVPCALNVGRSEPYYTNQDWLMFEVGNIPIITSIPQGYGADAIVPCIKAGNMATRITTGLAVSGSAPINQGISVAASGAAITFSGTAPLAALVNMLASGPVTFGGSADIYGVAFMDATGDITFSGTAGLGGLFSIDASGTLTFGGSAVTHSLAFLETTEAGTTMTEATIAAAVWASILDGAASAEDAIAELYRLAGLDIANPMTVTPTSRVAGAISQDITGDGITTTTVTRT